MAILAYQTISRKPSQPDKVDAILKEAVDSFSQRDYNLKTLYYKV